EGAEYMFWNNVETKPGIGYPKEWENQDRYQGGWEVTDGWNPLPDGWNPLADDGSLRLRTGNRLSEVLNVFYNPVLPQMDDYYGEDPYSFTYEDLHTDEEHAQQPVARPESMVTGEEDIDITWNANWEDNAGGAPETGHLDVNFDELTDAEREALLQYEEAFMFYLPRICNHCANPACVGACPSGAAYKRDEDGIVLIDQDTCRAWRYCVSSCPYKKPYYNWRSGKMEKCILCYPRLEEGEAPACFHSCVGRIRYLGPLLIDADRVEEVASAPESELVDAHRDLILDPADPEVVAAAREEGVPEQWIDGAQRSPAYKMFVDWEIALPLHPEFRTLPMLFYVPPESPMRTVLQADGELSSAEGDPQRHLPDLEEYRIPLKYLANLFAAGETGPVRRALEKQLALRIYRRSLSVDGEPNTTVLSEAGLTREEADELHRYLAIADYDDRFVVPMKASEAEEETPYLARGMAGFDSDMPSSRGVFHEGAAPGTGEGGD
ncbi:MAG: nitrate reductase subunit beta, partial [Halodesulfurarchaeum sp.]